MKKYDETEILNILTDISIFQGLGLEDLQVIIPLLKPLSFSPDSLIIKEGERGRSMYVIHTGKIAVTRLEEDGEEILLQYLHSGSYFGELSLIDNLPRSANVRAVTDTEIYQLKKDDFDNLLSENKEIANTFYRNCLRETFSRFRHIIANFTFSQHHLREKSAILDELNRDLSHAQKVQRYFINTDYLDNEHISHDGIEYSYIYHPCIAIGGDFLNIVPVDDEHFGMIIADVEGHGITAALATGVLRSAFSIGVRDYGLEPVRLLEFLNRHFNEVLAELYATCYYALINTKKNTITMAKAGHHHPLYWKSGSEGFVSVDCTGTGLGLMPDATFGQVEYQIEPGDKFFFFTDGIIEQLNEGMDMYSKNRLRSLTEKLIKSDEKEILNKLFQDLEDFSGDHPLEDDVTMVLFEF